MFLGSTETCILSFVTPLFISHSLSLSQIRSQLLLAKLPLCSLGEGLPGWEAQTSVLLQSQGSVRTGPSRCGREPAEKIPRKQSRVGTFTLFLRKGGCFPIASI